MARQRRVDFPGGRYHVFNRGANRQSIFGTDADRVEFGRLLGEVAEMFDIRVLAYCLMGNHYHLVLHCPEGNLSKAMHRLSFIYTKHVNERHGRDGPLFRGRFASIPIHCDRYLLTAVRYVHRNALDLPGVGAVEQYRWSSHRAYLGLRRTPPFLSIAPVLRYFGDDRSAFHRFVSDQIGSDRRTRLAPSEITATVALAVMTEPHGIDDGTQRPWLARIASIVLLDVVPDEVATSLFEELGRPSTRSRQRSRKRAEDDPTVGRIVRTVCELLGIDVGVAPATECA